MKEQWNGKKNKWKVNLWGTSWIWQIKIKHGVTWGAQTWRLIQKTSYVLYISKRWDWPLFVSHHIYGKTESLLCRLNGIRNETVQHILCACGKLVQQDYKRGMATLQKCSIKKYQMIRKRKWFQHSLLGVVENGVWYIQCDHVSETVRLGLIFVNKAKRNCSIIDIAVPEDEKVHQRQNEKVEKYQDLKREK